MKYPILFFCAYILCSCSSVKNNKPSIKQGIYGNVLWFEGNMMPSPDAKNANSGRPIKRTIRFYSLTNLQQVSGMAPLFKSVSTSLIAETTSNEQGCFVCKLKPGFYSVFTVEPEQQLFANSFNGKGDIAVCEVKEGMTTKLEIKVNYKAVH